MHWILQSGLLGGFQCSWKNTNNLFRRQIYFKKTKKQKHLTIVAFRPSVWPDSLIPPSGQKGNQIMMLKSGRLRVINIICRMQTQNPLGLDWLGQTSYDIILYLYSLSLIPNGCCYFAVLGGRQERCISPTVTDSSKELLISIARTLLSCHFQQLTTQRDSIAYLILALEDKTIPTTAVTSSSSTVLCHTS